MTHGWNRSDSDRRTAFPAIAFFLSGSPAQSLSFRSLPWCVCPQKKSFEPSLERALRRRPGFTCTGRQSAPDRALVGHHGTHEFSLVHLPAFWMGNRDRSALRRCIPGRGICGAAGRRRVSETEGAAIKVMQMGGAPSMNPMSMGVHETMVPAPEIRLSPVPGN